MNKPPKMTRSPWKGVANDEIIIGRSYRRGDQAEWKVKFDKLWSDKLKMIRLTPKRAT